MGTSAKTNPWLWGPVIALMVSTFLEAFEIWALAELTACRRVGSKQRKGPVLSNHHGLNPQGRKHFDYAYIIYIILYILI